MKELPRFSAEDGHIESVLIGSGQVKVSFQTWDCRKLTLIYSNVEKIISRFSVAEIGEYTMNCLDNGNNQYTFYEACEDVPSLTIKAEGVKIYEVGKHADINAALFDVGMDYIGNQIYENK